VIMTAKEYKTSQPKDSHPSSKIGLGGDVQEGEILDGGKQGSELWGIFP